MLSFIKKLFGFGPATPVAEVPYKVETPVIVLTDAPAAVVEVAATPAIKAKKAPAAKKPRAKKA